MTQDFDIAIVGAGAAGVGAARRLAGSGLSTLILEALPRLGGRAWTQKVSGIAVDLGCGWLHSGDRNPWTRIAEESGFAVDRRAPAWGTQYRDLGFPPSKREAARAAFAKWNQRVLAAPPESDRAIDLLVAEDAEWTAYLQAMSGFISGDELERISVKDYAAYDAASTNVNWRVPAGYGTLIAASLPAGGDVQVNAPVEAITLDQRRVALRTRRGTVRARAAILTVSTNVLASESMILPSLLDPWREAAARLPLGNDEKIFLEIIGESPFESESNVLGDPYDAETGIYYIRPFGWPVIECFLGGAGARAAVERGADAAFARAIEQLVRLFGSAVRRHLKPLIASDWTSTPTIGGAYSHALPGQAEARSILARPFDGRLFFAGEATHQTDFSTAHGAYLSGVRAAEEVLAVLTPGSSGN